MKFEGANRRGVVSLYKEEWLYSCKVFSHRMQEHK